MYGCSSVLVFFAVRQLVSARRAEKEGTSWRATGRRKKGHHCRPFVPFLTASHYFFSCLLIFCMPSVAVINRDGWLQLSYSEQSPVNNGRPNSISMSATSRKEQHAAKASTRVVVIAKYADALPSHTQRQAIAKFPIPSSHPCWITKGGRGGYPAAKLQRWRQLVRYKDRPHLL
jgi:hypothetical protein